MLKTCLVKSLLLLALLTPLSGCMTSPGAWEDTGSKSTPYFFSGFMIDPNEEVYLYAKRSANEWELVGKTTSSSTVIKHFGLNWYSWNIVTTLPEHVWHPHSSKFIAVVQARDKDGKPLKNWKEGFYDYFMDYDDLSELWCRYGEYDEVLIFASE